MNVVCLAGNVFLSQLSQFRVTRFCRMFFTYAACMPSSLSDMLCLVALFELTYLNLILLTSCPDCPMTTYQKFTTFSNEFDYSSREHDACCLRIQITKCVYRFIVQNFDCVRFLNSYICEDKNFNYRLNVGRHILSVLWNILNYYFSILFYRQSTGFCTFSVLYIVTV